MLRFIVVLAAIGVTIYALIDCLRTPPEELRGVPKPVWLVLIVLFAPIGGIVWILVSRWTPGDGGGGGGGGGPRTVAPDDDPDFLHSLDLEKDKERKGRRDDEA